MRVQRTRSSPSAHRSPLTRYPLGAGIISAARRAAVGVTLMLACSGSPGYADGNESVLTRAEQAEAVVFARLVEKYSHMGGGAVFICIGDDDPRPAVVDAVAKLTSRKIRPCHAAAADDARPAVPIDPESGVAGIELWIKHLTLVAPDEYRMEGGYLCGIDCSEGLEFLLREKGSTWAITFETSLWIS